ncbi:MAG: Rieske 2Fe-2S domain-containing protein [Chloroflexota bacterium]|nr:Rieske 2Fe-2S domain-containing protein [Chloroflexota bacterium]
MLSREDNELLTQTGPGTPQGVRLRRFWMPVLLSEELPEPDCPPVRIKALSEPLVAFRDSEGEVGVVDNYCPHRRASLFFGRNEECGIRCVYHGWKFDVNGDCVDMPSEPAESNFKDKVKIKAYPARDYGSCVWVYMGPPELQPELPAFEWARVPDDHRVVTRFIQHSNYMQCTEGEIDSSHVSFLHSVFDLSIDYHRDMRTGQQQGGRNSVLSYKFGAPQLTVKETDYGFTYGSRRGPEEGNYYWRVTQWMLPMFSLIPGPAWPRGGRGWVPIDDEHIVTFQYSYNGERPLTPEERARAIDTMELQPYKYTLPGGDIIDTYRSVRAPENDYLIERKTSGANPLASISNQFELALVLEESMGAIVDRSKEQLDENDIAVVAARKMLMKAAIDLREGTEPAAAHMGHAYNVRAASTTLGKGETLENVE